MSPLTFNKYEGDWRRHLRPTFGRLPLAAIDQQRIVSYMRKKYDAGLSESTVKNSLVALSGMLTDAVTEGHIQTNPLRTPKKARHRGGSRHGALDLQVKRDTPKHLEVSEALRLLDAVPEPYVDMVLLALTTGFRRNEILGLQWEWIDFGTNRIDLRGQLYWRRLEGQREREPAIVRCKYDSEREVPLYSGLATQLAPKRQATGFVFINPNTGKPCKEGKPTELFLEPAYETAGLRRRGQMWHTLRHTYASVLAAGGIKRHEVEQLMGHKTVSTTSIYTHLFREAYADVESALVAIYGRTPRKSPRTSPEGVSAPRALAPPPRRPRRFKGRIDGGGRRPPSIEFRPGVHTGRKDRTPLDIRHMDLFVVDDSKQASPTRDGMGPLVAVGGLHVPGDQVRDLESQLDALCDFFGFPPGEEFKWSPNRRSWEHRHLIDQARDEFNLGAQSLARSAKATAIVAMEDTMKAQADPTAASAEEDVMRMFLERAQSQMTPGGHGIVIADRPGGGHQAERDFLSASLAAFRAGTSYTNLDRLALAVSTDSKLSRLLQQADVVTACATAYVAGESRFAPRIFREGVLPLLRSDYGCVGGRGLKIHPDFRYGNLHHWLLGDEMFVRYQGGVPLPSTRFTAYQTSPTTA